MLFRYQCILKSFKRSVTWSGPQSVELSFGDNKKLKIESGSLARFADGSATAKLGETVVLSTVVSKDNKNTSSFVPLTVDYRQRSTAAGLIPTTWNRREMGVVDREILNARIIDRSIRPLFATAFSNDTQVICTTHSIDTLHNPLVLAINSASAALSLSDIPWNGPVGAVQVGLNENDDIIINPTNKQLQTSSLNIIITVSHDDKIVMIDGNGDEIEVEVMKKAMMMALKEGRLVIDGIRKLQTQVGRTKRRGIGVIDSSDGSDVNDIDESNDGARDNVEKITNKLNNDGIKGTDDVTRGDVTWGDNVGDDLELIVNELCGERIEGVFKDHSHDKFSRDTAVKKVREEMLLKFKQSDAQGGNVGQEENAVKMKDNGIVTRLINSRYDVGMIDQAFNKLVKRIFRGLVLETGRRCDGRGLDELREISGRVNCYPVLHGSALFQRGQTQVSCSTTLGSCQSVVRLDAVSSMMTGERRKDFFLHYEFPPYGTNEIGRTGFIGRRELGHGALAEKALKTVLPNDYPFSVLLSAEVLESNGSSSMASVCAGSMALMDAGVPISELVSGVAMGLISATPSAHDKPLNTSQSNDGRKCEDNPAYVILTDLMGIDDYMGDMDFKIASTRNGLTAVQMDTKLPGLSTHIIFESLDKAVQANNRIIEMMRKVVGEGRSTPKPNHPMVEEMHIPLGKRAKFVGVGGNNIKNILTHTGVHITPVDEDTFQVFAPNPEALTEAKVMIDKVMAEEAAPQLDFGAIYKVRIDEIKETGVTVILHTSIPPIFIPNNQLDSRKVKHPSSLGMTQGQELKVKYFGRDPVSGKIRLSRKVLQVLTSDFKNHL